MVEISVIGEKMERQGLFFYLGAAVLCLSGILAGWFLASRDPGLGPIHHLTRAWMRFSGAPPLWRSLGVDYPALQPSAPDMAMWTMLDNAGPGFPSGRTKGFHARLLAATGFETIEPRREDGGGIVKKGRSGPYLGGQLSELFIEYQKPQARVRVLFASHGEGAQDLLIVIPGSWGTSEHILGLRKEDYHRVVGRRFFEKGMDVAAFDQATNGLIEAWLNTLLKINEGQAYGLWARGICDLMDGAGYGWRQRYRRVFLHGLSRASRTVEYISALCPGFSMVFAEDNMDADYQRFFWGSPSASSHLKYGVWIDHLTPLIGQSSMADFILDAQSPMVYTSSEEQFRSMLPLFEKGFVWREGLDDSGRLRLVFKSHIGHKPEIELMETMMAGNWERLSGITLVPRDVETP